MAFYKKSVVQLLIKHVLNFEYFWQKKDYSKLVTASQESKICTSVSSAGGSHLVFEWIKLKVN